jgi:C4-dicarboxylate-binding protein DctP
MKSGRRLARLDTFTSSPEVHTMDGRRNLAAGVLVAATALLAACVGGPAAAGPSGVVAKDGGVVNSTLKASLATVNSEGADEADFADSLRKSSGGALDVTVQWSWRMQDLNSETDLINDVAAGKAELGLVGARAFDTVGVTSFMGLQAPFLIDSFDLETKVLAADWAQKLLDGPRSIGVVGLDYVQGPLRQPLGITRTFAEAADFQGARIGIRPSHVNEMVMKALGATPVSWGNEDLASLDGIEMDASSIAGNKYDVGAKALTGNVVFTARPSVIIANAKWFDGLSPDQQQLVRSTAAAVDQRTIKRVRLDASGAADLLCRRSLTVANASSQAIDELKRLTQPVMAELEKDPGTKAAIDAITSLRGSTPADAFAPCPVVAASPTPATGPSPLDGIWATSYTKAELAASPLLYDASEINDGNWGDLTLMFKDGKVHFDQRNSLGLSTTDGTFAVDGNVLRMTFVQGANAGETFVLRWSVYKNTLTLKRDESLGVGPTPFLVKAWTKTP